MTVFEKKMGGRRYDESLNLVEFDALKSVF